MLRFIKNMGYGRKHKASARQRGMTLLEVLIALSLMSLMATVFLGALGTTFITSQINEEQIIAEQLAKSQFDLVKSDNYTDNSTGPYGPYADLTIPDGYYLEPLEYPQVEFFNPKNNETYSDNDTGLQRITVKVCKGDGNCEELLFTLIGYKLDED